MTQGRCPLIVVVCALALTTTACLTDFERFRGIPAQEDAGDDNLPDAAPEDVGEEEDVQEPDAGEPDVEELDAAPDAEEDAPDVIEPDDVGDDAPDLVEDEPDVMAPQPIGGICAIDEDCPEGQRCDERFEGGLCTVDCAVDEDCPEEAVCGAEAGVPVCLLQCNLINPCVREDAIGARLTCERWFGASPQVCVSDDDSDQVLDSQDNCPEISNNDQRDVDRDGVGDVCDEVPQCGAQVIIDEPLVAVERPAPPRALRSGAWTHIPARDQVIFAGGLNDDNEPVTDVDVYDLGQQQWQQGALPSLPYPAYNQSVVVDTFRRELVATPGQSIQGVPSERLLLLNLEGTPAWRLGPTLPQGLGNAQATYLFPHAVVIVGYQVADDGEPGQRRLVALLYDRDAGEVRELDAGAGFLLNAEAQGALRVDAQADGRVYIFNPQQRDRVYVADPTSETLALLVNPDNQEERLAFELFFDLLQGQAPPPILSFATPFPLVHYVRMDTGEVAKIFMNEALPQNTEYDLILPEGTADPGASVASVYLRDEASLLTIVTPPAQGEPSESVLVEHNLGCLDSPVLTVFDVDRDEVPDLIDNCPRDRNPEQSDLDGDTLGDECDPDVDGDEIPNQEDAIIEDGLVVTDLSRDTDNDGRDNGVDLDDDGDRVLDFDDAYPLDTDNDRIPNRLDEDDDGDGVSDEAERAAGSDPTEVLSIPGGDRVAMVLDDGETRSLVVTTLSELAEGQTPTPVTLPPGHAPSWPRLLPGQRSALYADLSTPAPSLVAVDLNNELEPLVVSQPGLRRGGFDLRQGPTLDEVVVLRDIDDGEGGTLSVMESLVMSTQEATRLRADSGVALAGLDIDDLGDGVVYGAGPASCAACLDLTTRLLPDGIDELLSPTDVGVAERHPRLSDGGLELLFIAAPQGTAQVFVLDAFGNLEALTPLSWHVDSADFAPSARRVLVSYRAADDPSAPYELALIDRESGDVWRFVEESGSLLELSFAR